MAATMGIPGLNPNLLSSIYGQPSGVETIFQKANQPYISGLGTPNPVYNAAILPATLGVTGTTPSAPSAPAKSVPQNTQTGGGRSLRDLFNEYRGMGGYAGWGETEAWANFQALGGPPGGGGGGGEVSADIESAYSPGLSALGEVETSARAGETTNLARVGEEYQGYLKQQGLEETGLRAGQTEQERLFGETTRSAADEARRAYAALVQQGRSKFGAGSSVGPAVGEIAAQEFARTQGKLGQVATAGQQALALESGRLNTFISQKKSDIDKWKRDAEAQIRGNLQATLDNITLRRGELESGKAAAKIDAINTAKSNIENLRTTDYNARLALIGSIIENAQTIAGRAFTGQEVTSMYNDLLGQIMQGIGPSFTPSPARLVAVGRKPDEWAGILNQPVPTG